MNVLGVINKLEHGAAKLDQRAGELDRYAGRHGKPDAITTAADDCRDAAALARSTAAAIRSLLVPGTIDPATTAAAELAVQLVPAARRLAEQQSGYPSGSAGGGSSYFDVEEGSRVEKLVERTDENKRPHISDRDYRLFQSLVSRLSVVTTAVLPTQVTVEYLAKQASDACPPGLCSSCWRIGHRSESRTDGSLMCRWCEDMARSLEVDMPPLQLVERHAQGKPITTRDVRLAKKPRR